MVYSLYNDDFKNSLNADFKNKILLDGITAEDVKILNEPNFENVTKMAVDYSDAVIFGSEKVNNKIIKYVQSSEKLHLDFQSSEDYIDTYNEFYEKV